MLRFSSLVILLGIVVALGSVNGEQQPGSPADVNKLDRIELCQTDTALNDTPLEGEELPGDAQVRTVISSSVLVVLLIVLIVVVAMILFLRKTRGVEKE
jgi:hypothetical protein